MNSPFAAARDIDHTKLVDSNFIQPTEWSADTFKDLLAKAQVNHLPSQTEAKQIALTYLNYLMTPDENSVVELTKLMILCCKTTGEDPHHVLQKALSDTGSELHDLKVKTEDVNVQDPPEADETTGTDFGTFANTAPAIPSVEQMTASYKALKKILESPTPQDAINWLSYYAMHTMRFGVKEKNSVYTALLEVGSKYGRVFKISTPCSSFIPCKLTVTKMATEFEKGKDGCKKIIPILVDHLNDPEADAIVKSSCLLSLSGVGIGALVWYVKLVAVKKPDEIDAYFSDVADTAVLESFNKIVDFLKIAQTSGDSSWRWCRILIDSALADFSTKKHTLFSSVCAFAVVKEQDRERILGLKQFADRDDPAWNMIKIACDQHLSSLTAKGMKPAVEGSILSQAIAAVGIQ